jgi:hypothetical protein
MADAAVQAVQAVADARARYQEQRLVELVEALADITYDKYDPESGHRRADRLLTDFIGDERVTEAFRAIYKWYS